MTTPVALTAELIEAFAGIFLSPRYDSPRPTPPFHRQAWKLYCSSHPQVACIAPRDHAKSTGLTFDYILAEVLFRQSDYVILIGSTEDKAGEQLSNISEELHENAELRKEFGVKSFESDTKTEIIVKMQDGWRFRILARGAEQRIRGSLWKGKRPNLIVCHAKGTWIEDEGREMLVEEHPTAQVVRRQGLFLEVHGLPYPERVTPEHRYWVQRIRQKKCAEYRVGVKVRNYTEYQHSVPGWQEAQDLDKTCWIGRPIDRVEQPAPEICELFTPDNEFWWLLGLWWGDGTLGARHYVTWYVADKGAASVGARVLAFFAKRGVHVSVSPGEGCSRYTVTHAQLYTFLSTWGYGNSLKEAPRWILRLPLDQQAEIIKGYVAADGWIDGKTQQVRLTSVCYTALLQVRWMLARLGLVGTIRIGLPARVATIQGREVKCQPRYDLMFRDGASRLGYAIQDSERYVLKRAFIENGFLWSQVDKTYSAGVQEFVPIQTASHTYLTAFGLSHNCDDMEDDEQVENKDRRAKFRRWFFRAAKQALSKSGKIRVHGTILHEDSLLNRIRRMKTWEHLFFKAHASFDDFSDLLWPERWTPEQLKARRQEFIEDGDAGGYSQEFLNDPQDNSDSFLRRDDFIPMTEADADCWKTVHAAADFAVSKADLANRTSFTIGGKCTRNFLHYLDFRVGRWDPVEWVDEMFAIQKRWNPEVFWVEDGVIWQSVKRFLYDEMRERDIWINCEAVPSIKDKATRGTSLRKRMRAGGTRWNTLAEGFENARDEMLRFTGVAAARLDDQFDSAALLSLGFDRTASVEAEDEIPEEEWSFRRQDPRKDQGRSAVTGY